MNNYVGIIYINYLIQKLRSSFYNILKSSVADPDSNPGRIHRIHMFLGLPDPDPLVRGMDPDPDPSIIMQK